MLSGGFLRPVRRPLRLAASAPAVRPTSDNASGPAGRWPSSGQGLTRSSGDVCTTPSNRREPGVAETVSGLRCRSRARTLMGDDPRSVPRLATSAVWRSGRGAGAELRTRSEAVAFYQRAFGAEEIYRNTYPDGRIVVG
jgi:hypothetical protein